VLPRILETENRAGTEAHFSGDIDEELQGRHLARQDLARAEGHYCDASALAPKSSPLVDPKR